MPTKYYHLHLNRQFRGQPASEGNGENIEEEIIKTNNSFLC